MNCKTCAFWAKPDKCWEPQKFGGFCTCPKILEEWGDSCYENDALVYSYSEGGRFWTGPDFGCVHHKERV